MDIAVITGASSGIGKEIAESIDKYYKLDEIWVVARTESKLNEIKSTIKIRVIPLDLTIDSDILKYKALLEEIKPNCKYLFNVSGYGKYGKFLDLDLDIWNKMIDLNITSITKMTYYTIPFMGEKSHIINVSSMASLMPIPYLSVYAATKAFVTSFTEALNRELKDKKIKAHALLPYWTKTNFMDVASKEKNDIVKKYPVMYDVKYVVNYMFKKVNKNKVRIIPGFNSKFNAVLLKFVSKDFAMKYWMRQQKLK